MKAINDTALNIKLPRNLYTELQEAAARKNISLASMVRLLCSEGLERDSGVPDLSKTPHPSDAIFDNLPGNLIRG